MGNALSCHKQANKANPALIKLERIGTYSWQLLFSYDNSGNDVSLTVTKEVKVTQTASYETLVKNIREQSEASTSSTSISVGFVFAILNFGVSGSNEHITSTKQIFESAINNHSSTTVETTTSRTVNIPPGAKGTMYQLVFELGGTSYPMDVLSSTRTKIDDIKLTFNLFPKRFLSHMSVVYTHDSASRPTNSIVELRGLNPDINADFGGVFVWLVPNWTAYLASGATSIQVVVQWGANRNYQDIAKGAGGDFRYLKMMNDGSNDKISELVLYRTKHKHDKPPGEWVSSGDINKGRGGDFLYICWKTKFMS